MKRLLILGSFLLCFNPITPVQAETKCEIDSPCNAQELAFLQKYPLALKVAGNDYYRNLSPKNIKDIMYIAKLECALKKGGVYDMEKIINGIFKREDFTSEEEFKQEIALFREKTIIRNIVAGQTFCPELNPYP